MKKLVKPQSSPAAATGHNAQLATSCGHAVATRTRVTRSWRLVCVSTNTRNTAELHRPSSRSLVGRRRPASPTKCPTPFRSEEATVDSARFEHLIALKCSAEEKARKGE